MNPENVICRVICRVLAAAGHADLDVCHQLAAEIFTELDIEMEYDDHDGAMPAELRWCTGWERAE